MIRRVLRTVFVSSLAAVSASTGGCASTLDDVDAEVEDSTADLSSRTAVSVTALQDRNWVASGSAAHDGDVLALRLLGDGTYIRLRCYGAACVNAVPETDRYTTFTSKGKTYVDFWSFVRVEVPGRPPKLPGSPSAPPEWDNKPVVADSYEIRLTPSGIKMRKTYGSRWVSLHVVDDQALCAASGGAWVTPAHPPLSTTPKTPPTTKGQQPATPPLPGTAAVAVASPAVPGACKCAAGEGYVAGAGGCIHLAISSESACDESNGSYLDDDATPIGTYCACGLGRVMTDGGCVQL